jgi:hypothetical protein
MSNTLQWRVQGIVRDAKGRKGVQYVIYGGDTYTVVARLADPAAARSYLESASATATFKNPNGRYARMARREQQARQRKTKSHGKTIVMRQAKAKTLAAAMKLAQSWHEDNN